MIPPGSREVMAPFGVKLDDLVQGVRTDVESMALEAGLRVMQMAMESERSRLVDGPDPVGYRWGSQGGYVVLNGQKVHTPSLRVRDFQNREIPLETYKRFQSREKLGESAFRDLLRGVSTRDYSRGVTSLVGRYGVGKSCISRHFMDKTREELARLTERDLRGWDLGVIFIDGIHYAGLLLVVAMGIDIHGRKHTLGLWQGATENTVVCRELLEDLIRRGLNPTRNYLFIIDGGKGLRAALDEVFGPDALVQRCQEHKKRNVIEHLPKTKQKEWRGRLAAAYHQPSYEKAKSALWECVEDLRVLNPSAARSLLEGMEETLTLQRIEAPRGLWQSLSTTNVLESSFSIVRGRTNRVGRWQEKDHVQRWVASALLQAEERSWMKVKGWKNLWKLWEQIGRKEDDNVKTRSYNRGPTSSSFN